MEPWNASLSGTDLDYSQEETDKADPVTEDLGGQAGIKGRCSCNLDRAALTMKRYKKQESMSYVCKMYVTIDKGGQPVYKKGTGLVQLEGMGEQICFLEGTIPV